jgi:hypothetical protein
MERDLVSKMLFSSYLEIWMMNKVYELVILSNIVLVVIIPTATCFNHRDPLQVVYVTIYHCH